MDSRLETVQAIDSDTGVITGEKDVLFRQFEVVETLKGTSDQGDQLWIAFEPGLIGEVVDGTGEVREFRQSQSYVLFLKGRLRPLEYPADYGPVLWTGNGEPAFAELRGDILEFWADSGYLELLLEEGLTLPEPSSAAPFELTLTETRDMAK